MMNSPIDRVRGLLEPVFRVPDFIQSAALCLREGKTGREVLMVTSRGTRRWVLPKGWPMKGRTLAGGALREAWEEAGVIGTVEETPIGWYSYDKTRKGGLPLSCRVEVFRVRVDDLAADWPERRQRKRAWLPIETAIAQVQEPGLKAMLERLG